MALAVKKKKVVAKKVNVRRKLAVKPKASKAVSPEVREANEQLEWKKEKREYWSSRFRKILADIALKPKKKVNTF